MCLERSEGEHHSPFLGDTGFPLQEDRELLCAVHLIQENSSASHTGLDCQVGGERWYLQDHLSQSEWQAGDSEPGLWAVP